MQAIPAPMPITPLITEENINWEGVVPQKAFIQSTAGTVNIIGKIRKGANIESRGNLSVIGSVFRANLKSGHAATIKGDILKKSRIESKDDLKVIGKIAARSILKSGYTTTITGRIGKGCTILSARNITAQNIGDKCKVTASWFGVTAKNIGKGVLIKALNGGLKANKVGENSIIETGCDVVINEPIPDSVTIRKPKNGNIYIAGQLYCKEISPQSRAEAKRLQQALEKEQTGFTINQESSTGDSSTTLSSIIEFQNGSFSQKIIKEI